jgi:hypothetical protein
MSRCPQTSKATRIIGERYLPSAAFLQAGGRVKFASFIPLPGFFRDENCRILRNLTSSMPKLAGLCLHVCIALIAAYRSVFVRCRQLALENR